jgi:hypothetical protein
MLYHVALESLVCENMAILPIAQCCSISIMKQFIYLLIILLYVAKSRTYENLLILLEFSKSLVQFYACEMFASIIFLLKIVVRLCRLWGEVKIMESFMLF